MMQCNPYAAGGMKMKKPCFSRLNAPVAAVLAGIALLLGALPSSRFVLALLGVVLIGWGLACCCKG